ncbi:hypothetical protein BJ165DRAFT_856992 [Panaeolus papilionaceus]|nr:hypothetical protein BJ165DRAFT_856992 [Panaeolus papilionaceus]
MVPQHPLFLHHYYWISCIVFLPFFVSLIPFPSLFSRYLSFSLISTFLRTLMPSNIRLLSDPVQPNSQLPSPSDALHLSLRRYQSTIHRMHTLRYPRPTGRRSSKDRC